MTVAVEVRLWGRRIGAVHQPPDRDYATFQYDPEFAGSGIAVAPLMMPLARHPYEFPELDRRTFGGLPGLLSDSLPDFFGNALIDAWLARQGRSADEFTPLERLCYVGTRGMGALEFQPAVGPAEGEGGEVEVGILVELATRILEQRKNVAVRIAPGTEEGALVELLRVGSSAGGARAKALIAWNPDTNEIRSGQVEHDSGFTYWILKFDGVSHSQDSQLGESGGYGAVEFAYSLMARAAGIRVAECRLFAENDRRHFMTRRFDRTPDGKKLHMLSLGGLAHMDFNQAGAYGYEQALGVIRRIGLSMDDVEEQFRRMVFNVLARNQDDHVKNIGFLMDKQGKWSLSPAYDVTYAFNPSGLWTARHQMTINGKRDGITLADFTAVAHASSMKRGRADAIYDEVREAVIRWREFAGEAQVYERNVARVEAALRTDLPTG